MICPFCKEEIIDGALKCKHCGSMLNQSSASSSGGVSQDPLTTIEQIPISDKVKLKFKAMHNAHYDYNSNQLKVGFGDSFKYFNLWAFLFSVIYYFAKGMWKKGLALLGAWFVVVVIFINASPAFFNIIGIVFSGFVGSMGYVDLYRKQVLKQDFWW